MFNAKGLVGSAVACVLMLSGTSASASDDTLEFYLSKSDLVVVGEVTSDPIGISRALGAMFDECDVKITQVLKGSQRLQGKTIRISALRYDLGAVEDQARALKKGGKHILFLKDAGANQKPPWSSADVWFGVQPASKIMADMLLKRLAEAEKPDAKR